eukprot:2982677-Rhodomonas_salina.2
MMLRSCAIVVCFGVYHRCVSESHLGAGEHETPLLHQPDNACCLGPEQPLSVPGISKPSTRHSIA